MGLAGGHERAGAQAAAAGSRGVGLVAVEERVRRALRRQLVQWRGELSAGAERVGWKIGRGLVESEEHLEPVVGYLTSRTRVVPGGFCPNAGLRDPRVDAELAIEIGGQEQPVRYGATLELVDVTRPPSDFESIVAANIWHRGFATGPLHREPPPEVVHAAVSVNGAVAGEGKQRVDPLETARIVGELLNAVGERLQPGDLIIAGSIVHVPVHAGDVVVELEDVGAVGVRLG